MSFDDVANKTTIYGISDFNQIPADVPANLISGAIKIRDWNKEQSVGLTEESLEMTSCWV
jgi:hypothetical protein